jgi:lysophospholipase L1-like esterase
MTAMVFWTNLALAFTVLLIRNLSAAEASAAAARGEAVAVCVEKGPAMDGTLQGPLWEKCPAWPMGECTSEKRQKYATWAKVLFDSAHVYVGVYCEEPDTAALVAKIAKRDGPVWEDDSVELFLRPDPQERVYQFVVNALGTLYDARDKDPAYNSTAEVKVHVEKGKAWTVTLKVPMRQVGACVGEDQMWTLNIYRSRPARGADKAMQYSWAVMSDADYHNAREFGVVTGVKVPKTEGGVVRVRATPLPRRVIPQRGTEVGGVTVYHKSNFDAGAGGWEGVNSGKATLTEDATSGKALHVECEKGWAGVRLPLAIRGSKDLKLALLMKGTNLPAAGVNVHDTVSGDNTTPYGHRYFKDRGWTPILYRLDRCRYNSALQGYVGPATLYDELRFFGPWQAKPGTSFTMDNFVIYRGTDRQPPEKVTGLKAEATTAGVKLCWLPAADNVGAQVYVIARGAGAGGFRKIAESNATSYADHLAPADACRYRVFAIDFEENYGPWSEPVTVDSMSEPRKTALSPEEEDRLGYAQRIAAVHARGASKVRKGHATLFGDSLTGATLYPQCAEAAFGTLTVNAFGYPSMRTDFARNKVADILKQDNPEFMFILYGTNNGKAAKDLPSAMGDLAAVVKACDQSGTVAVLGTIPPRGWTTASQPEADYNAEVVKLCRNLKIPASYIFEGFQAAGAENRKTYMGGDGVHWRGEGMEIAARAWGRTLDQIRFVIRDQK